jgi:hypothetical protein
MQTAQFAGLGVTTAVVLAVDLPLDWLCALAVLCGALATYGFTFLLKAKR